MERQTRKKRIISRNANKKGRHRIFPKFKAEIPSNKDQFPSDHSD